MHTLVYFKTCWSCDIFRAKSCWFPAVASFWIRSNSWKSTRSRMSQWKCMNCIWNWIRNHWEIEKASSSRFEQPLNTKVRASEHSYTACECNSPDLSALIYPALTGTIYSDQIIIYFLNALCLCFVLLYLSFLALGCSVSSLPVYKLHCDSQYRAGCCQYQSFYGEKLKQAVYEPRPRYMNVIVLGAQIQFNLTHSYPLLKKESKNQMDLGMYKFSAIYSCVSLESWR